MKSLCVVCVVRILLPTEIVSVPRAEGWLKYDPCS